MKHACALLFALAGSLSADAIFATTEVDCNGLIEATACEVFGPEVDGETSYFSVAESEYFYALSEDGLSFEGRAAAGGIVGATRGLQSEVYSSAFSTVQFFFLTSGNERPGFVSYRGGGGGDGSASRFAAGFSLFGVNHLCISRSEMCGNSGRIQIQLGIPFMVLVEAYGGGNFNPDGGGRGNGSGATGSVNFQLFESDGVTPVRLLWDDGLEGVPNTPTAAPEPANIGVVVIGCTVLYCIRRKNQLKFTM